MTTIATDGKSMAGDGTLNCCGAVVSRTARKIFRLNDGRIYGGCGEMKDIVAVLEWLNGGEKPDVGKDFGALVIAENIVLWSDDNLSFIKVEVPVAMGSGMHYAMGAMYAGADPAKAVGISSLCDCYTGGDIIVESLS